MIGGGGDEARIAAAIPAVKSKSAARSSRSSPPLVRAVRLLVRKRGAYIPGVPGGKPHQEPAGGTIGAAGRG